MPLCCIEGSASWDVPQASPQLSTLQPLEEKHLVLTTLSRKKCEDPSAALANLTTEWQASIPRQTMSNPRRREAMEAPGLLSQTGHTSPRRREDPERIGQVGRVLCFLTMHILVWNLSGTGGTVLEPLPLCCRFS